MSYRYEVFGMRFSATRIHSRPRAIRGFTLMELMIVLAVVAITFAIIMPSLSENRRNNDVASQNLSLVGMLNFTKSEAVRRNTEVTMLFSNSDGVWSAIVEDPAEEADIEGCVPGQLRCVSHTNAALTGGLASLSFNNRGYIRDAEDAWTPATLYIQHLECSGTAQRRRIDITPTGQVSSCSLPCDSVAACP